MRESAGEKVAKRSAGQYVDSILEPGKDVLMDYLVLDTTDQQ